MLTIISGAAASGKTNMLIEKISEAVKNREPKNIFIVPEQFSFEAERELALRCGDSLSLFAEVMSFTSLARRLESETGNKKQYIDEAGRLLLMSLALETVTPSLKLYQKAKFQPETKRLILDALDELKSANISTDALFEVHSQFSDQFSTKLYELILIRETYLRLLSESQAEPSDRLTVLAQNIEKSDKLKNSHIYIDGFTDLTMQQFEVLRALMSKGLDITICLTIDNKAKNSEVFDLSRRTSRILEQDANSRGIEVRKINVEAKSESFAQYYANNLFSYGGEAVDCGDFIKLYSADSLNSECEFAAAEVIRLVRDEGYRYRDISIAVRNFEAYRPSLEAAFSYYGIPLYTSKKTNVMQKPLPMLLSALYDILLGNWEIGDVFSYLRTGLCGIDIEDCDLLENYCLTWNISISHWLSPRPWRMHPDGYGGVYTEDTQEKLGYINELRHKVSRPIIDFSKKAKQADTAKKQAEAILDFVIDIKLAETIKERAEYLQQNNEAQKAAEYQQLWKMFTGALEQIVAVAADVPMDTQNFSRTLMLSLAQYELATVPVSLDMVQAGDLDRMRQRNLKQLIILGAYEGNIPASKTSTSLFTDEEKRILDEYGLALDAGDCELWREFSLIYNTVSLPKDRLTIVTPEFSSSGSVLRPSIIMKRAEILFDAEITKINPRESKKEAKNPAIELVSEAINGLNDDLSKTVREYFKQNEAFRLEKLESAATSSRSRLSRESAALLYGEKPWITASRVDKFKSCRFSYFLQYGLRAKPRKNADFAPPEYGTFMHFILENVARDVAAAGGFALATKEFLDELTDKYVEQYISDTMNDFEDKTARFSYLFRRLISNAKRIVWDMAEELKNSDFVPIEFEFDLARLTNVDSDFNTSGIVDRIDAWVSGDKLYLRVVDYKTGKKSFSLSDVLYGLNLQMLVYLFNLQKAGENVFGKEVVPAGIMYSIARDDILSAKYCLSDSELQTELLKKQKRTGLFLDDAEVLYAMEKSEKPVRLPIKWKDGTASGDSLASLENLGRLSKNIENTLENMAKELKSGSILADPYFKGAQDNACYYCDYVDACRFNEKKDRRKYIKKLPADRVWNILADGKVEK